MTTTPQATEATGQEKTKAPPEGALPVAVHGACGRMGRAVIRAVADSTDTKLVAALEHEGHGLLGQDAGLIAGTDELGIPVSFKRAKGLTKARVVVDFSLPAGIAPLVAAATEAGVAIVSGTTGLEPREMDALEAHAQKHPVVFAPNMSVAMNVLFALTENATRALGPTYDAEIIEYHHHHKKDAPSGTALSLGETVAKARDETLQSVGRFTRHGPIGPRKEGEIGVVAVRAGEIVGEHTVMFAGPNERLELSHRVTSRDNFAQGALVAARWVVKRSAGLFDMQDVLGLR